MDDETRERRALATEEKVRERVDDDGTRWRKVYFGAGEHLKNWLEQTREIVGDDDVRVEPVGARGLACFEGTEPGPARIWVRVRNEPG